MAGHGRKTVCLSGVVLGAGMPAVCIPVMGGDIGLIGEAAARAYAAKADVIELRIDSLSPMPTADEAITACRAVRENAPDTALLFTLRTARDGGAGSEDAAAYEALLSRVCRAQAADAIDCELSVGEDAFRRIAGAAHAYGVAVVGSSHEFGEIGDMEKAAVWLKRQEALGADICKAAVMTHTKAEAMLAAYVMARTGEELSVPMIAIAMGPSGVITRIGAQCMGSCLTFGTAGAASAPGQIDAKALRSVLEIVCAAQA